jgi:hypothetical protein
MSADEFLTDNLTLGAFIEASTGTRAMMRPNKDGQVTMVFSDCEEGQYPPLVNASRPPGQW